MNALVKAGGSAPALNEEDAIRVLQNSLYPGAKPESVRLVLAWCRATGRDPMKKPIHIVPMYVKDAVTGQGGMRDVLMPGIGTYRTDAATSGQYAGKDEPEFGPDTKGNFDGMTVMHPLWCKVTVKRIVHGSVCSFTAKEFWVENYAAGREKKGVNDMWRKRPYGQLAKVAEAQALRMAFPDETGNTNTSEEMDGKTFDGMTIDAEPVAPSSSAPPPSPSQSKGPTAAQWLDALQTRLEACSTQMQVADIVADEKTQRMLGWLTNGALKRLENMIDAAEQRTRPAIVPDEGDIVAFLRTRLEGCTSVEDIMQVGSLEPVDQALQGSDRNLKDELNAMLSEAFAKYQPADA